MMFSQHSYFSYLQIDDEEKENNEIINLEMPKTQLLTQVLTFLVYNWFHDRLYMIHNHLFMLHDHSFILHDRLYILHYRV